MNFLFLVSFTLLNLLNSSLAQEYGSSLIRDNFNSGFAVVLIDMQEGFYNRGGVEGSLGLKTLVHNQSRLSTWAKGNLVPILVLEYEHFGQTDASLMEIVQKTKHIVIQKNSDGGFNSNAKDAILLHKILFSFENYHHTLFLPTH